MLKNRLVGSLLLICGTCIGAGMLGLPIITAPNGPWIAVALLFICWLFTYCSALFVIEVTLSLPEESSFMSMAERTLGKSGRLLAGAAYWLLLYSLVAAYLSGGGDLCKVLFRFIHLKTMINLLSPLPWATVIGLFMYLGTQYIDQLNRVLVMGLMITFLALIVELLPHIQLARLKQPIQTFNALTALPVVITSFGYHVVLPSVRNYLGDHPHSLVRAVYWGSLIPLIIYLIWLVSLLSIIPFAGHYGLHAILMAGHPTVQLSNALLFLLHEAWLTFSLQGFIVFALASSFVGVALSLFDFLADGLNIPKTPIGCLKLIILTLLPPYLYAVFYPRGFMLALSYAGIFVAILNILLPTLMVYKGRQKGLCKGYQAPGGTILLVLTGCFALLVIAAHL